jgi:mono/diheme cytochrome c family protein
MSKKTARLLTLITVVFLIITSILLFTGPRMKHQPSLKTFKALPRLPSPESVPLNSTAYTANATFPDATKKNLESGKVYYGYYCIFCHGGDSKGNGQVGISYVPKPANLTTDSIRKFSNEHFLWAMLNGAGHSPVLERVISPEYRGYIVVYVKNGIK